MRVSKLPNTQEKHKQLWQNVRNSFKNLCEGGYEDYIEEIKKVLSNNLYDIY